MARLARVVVPECPHHVTQRGNGRRFILQSDAGRQVYWQLLQRGCQLHRLSLLGWCLMSNHVHLIVVPQREDSLARALKETHGRYASYLNTCEVSSGHVWQGRYYSCPLDEAHLWAALRYTELNPVRAGMVADAEQYRWSSAALHCGQTASESVIELDAWSESWTAAGWRDYLRAGVDGTEDEAIRRHTHTGRPLGTAGFIATLERTLQRPLSPGKGGRPAKEVPDTRQGTFPFGEI
ncbi:MAG: transposase [Bryobacteraceae bacterium]|jgi:putative transposase